MIRKVLLSSLLSASISIAAFGQGAPILEVGVPVDGSLDSLQTKSYRLPLDANQFVIGTVNQKSVDVVITVTGPNGEPIHRVDESAEGDELLQFRSAGEGDYTITIAPFRNDIGLYDVLIGRVERGAVTAYGKVNQLMARYDRPDWPGATIGIIQSGEVIFERGYGMANIGLELPNSADVSYNIGSVSKQFTAMAITMLNYEGKLSLNDDVRKHIPELPDFGDVVTLRHLLTHTSGLREVYGTTMMAGRHAEDAMEQREIIPLIMRQEALQNAPGSAFNYNNSGYSLLAEVVTRVTGTPFTEWSKANLFDPLDMDRTTIKALRGQIIKRQADSYRPIESGWETVVHNDDMLGSGNIYSTIHDLGRWVRNYRDMEVGGESVHKAMRTPMITTTGDTLEYGLGLFIGNYRGQDRIYHAGADAGYRAALHYYPDLDAAIIVLGNDGDMNSTQIAEAVADAFFEDEFETEVASDAEVREPTTISEPAASRYVGRYRLNTTGDIRMISHRNGVLIYDRMGGGTTPLEISEEGGLRFFTSEVDMLIVPVATEGPREFEFFQNGEPAGGLTEVLPWNPDEEELATYEGRYLSDELEAVYTIRLDDSGTLHAIHARSIDLEMEPRGRDMFGASFPIGSIEFERDADGRISGFTASNGRTRGMVFVRIEK